MATLKLASHAGTFRSLVLYGGMLALAGVAGVVSALVLKKAPQSPDGEKQINDPAIRLWAAEALVGSGAAPSGPNVVESVVRAGAAKGIKMVSLPWDSARDRIKEHGPLPVLLTHRSLPPFLLLDVFSWEGETLFLGTAANGGAAVFTDEEFRAAPWKQAVWAQDVPSSVREVAVGQAKVSVDRAWHSFSAVNPYSVIKTEFQLRNLSDQPVRIERIGTSCGCAAVPEITTRMLSPRAYLKSPLSLQTDGRRVVAQQVYIILSSESEERKKITTPLTLNLYAWQPQAMEVSPPRIDFGPVSRSKTAKSVIRLTESPVDRFEIQGIDFSGMTIRHSVEKSEREGLASYLVRLRLDGSALPTGEHSATIQVKTSSRFRPVVKIPVHVRIASEVKVRPAVVEFAPASKTARLEPVPVTLHHKKGKPLRVRVLEAKDGVHATVEKQGTQTLVKISVEPRRESKTGVVKLHAAWDEGHELVEVPCYYFAAP